MKGKRDYSNIENFAQLTRKKAIIIFFIVSLIILFIIICAKNTVAIQAVKQIEKIEKIEDVKEISKIEDQKEIGPIRAIILPPEEIIEEVSNEEEVAEEKEEIVKEEKVVTYKGKEVSIPVVEKAPVNDSEDQHQNSSTAGTATQTTVEEAKTVVSNNSSNSSDETYEHISNSVGIDVSKWNGTINWTEVKNAGIDFAMIRVGYRGSTQGTIVEDPYFRKNVNGAIKNGVKVGIYFFSMARTEEEAIQEAAWVVSAIRKYSITYPVAYDLESWGTGRIADVSYTQLTNNAIAFLGYIKSQGYTPMMYASKYDFNCRWEKSRIKGCKYWLAHYTTQTDYTGSYQMWQYSSKGSVPGINGDVDMNIAYFSYSNTEAPKHTCSFKLEKIIKEATCTEEGQELYRCECGDSKYESIPATGHSFGEWKVTKAPTEDSEGEKTRTCEKCHVEEKETIDKLPKTSTNNTNTINTTNDSNSNNSNNTTNTVNNETNTTNTIIDNTVNQDNDNSNTVNNTSQDNTTNETNSVDNSTNTTNTTNDESKNEVENSVNNAGNTINTSINDTNTVNENTVGGNEV